MRVSPYIPVLVTPMAASGLKKNCALNGFNGGHLGGAIWRHTQPHAKIEETPNRG